MLSLVLWYAAIVGLGWLAFPIGYRILRFLPDRALGVSKPLGLLLWGFAFWLPASLHLLRNDAGGVLLSLLAVGAMSWLAGRGHWAEIRSWLAANRRVWITAELLFLLAFALWAAMRAASPDATGTEKPMELAFINAIIASPQFPPHDPWLSGYAISYYYYGYVIVALLARLTGTLGSIAFNLGVASWFGLAATAGYGILYNLLEAHAGARLGPAAQRRGGSFLVALLAPLFILLVGNFGGFLEALHGAGIFWQPAAAPQEARAGAFPPVPECLTAPTARLGSPFWSWLDIEELNCPPVEPYRFAPTRPGWWWWRSSRVLTDYDLNNSRREVIDEFPAFSYLLGDLHPHVLSMPFVLLAVALAFNLYLRTVYQGSENTGWDQWLRQPEFWLAGVVLGGLAFLNIWDFPIYLALYAAAFGLARTSWTGRWTWSRLGETARLGLLLGFLGVMLYLPFYLGFASQAGGLAPSLSFFTRGIHFWVMFGTLLVPILLWGFVSWEPVSRKTFWRGVGLAAGLVFGLWFLSYAMGAVMLGLSGSSGVLLALQGGVQADMILPGSLARRLAFPGMWLSLLGILTMILGQLLAQVRTNGEPARAVTGSLAADSGPQVAPVEAGDPSAFAVRQPSDPARGFLLLMILVSCGLVLFPEFFYLRDQFGWRMNTIFKFYYQAWMLLAIAAAFAFSWLWKHRLAGLIALPATLVLFVSLFFSAFGIQERLSPAGGTNRAWSLDGANYLLLYQPDLYGAIEWLRASPQGVVAEAVGGSYNAEFARVATHSGKPTVLGWPGHEGQWRGGYTEIGSREADIAQLYLTSDWEQARQIIEKYVIRYIVVGPAEYSKYGDRIHEDKMDGHLVLAYDSPQVRIYEVPAGLK